MAETVPERIWIDLQAVVADDEGHRVTYDSENIHQEYVPATALEAAQARIQALEDTLNIERALSDGAHRRARAARREALEEAANLMDDIVYEIGARPMSSIHSALCEYRKRIRALMENPNES